MITIEIGEGSVTNFLNQIPIDKLINNIEKHGYVVVTDKQSANYVDIRKSMGTEPFYDMLVDAIEKGDLSLELLIGKATLKKLIPKS